MTYDYSTEEISAEVVSRRRALIAALRGEKYRQAKGSLYRNDGGRWGYCCIGVACSVIGIPDEDLIIDAAHEYLLFEKEYGVSEKVSRYLMAMNDGDQAGEAENEYGTTYIRNRIIRATQDRRSFAEIARFLEIIWQLTPNPKS